MYGVRAGSGRLSHLAFGRRTSSGKVVFGSMQHTRLWKDQIGQVRDGQATMPARLHLRDLIYKICKTYSC